MNSGNAQVHGCYPSGISLWINQDGFVVLTVSREYTEHGINLCQAFWPDSIMSSAIQKVSLHSDSWIQEAQFVVHTYKEWKHCASHWRMPRLPDLVMSAPRCTKMLPQHLGAALRFGTSRRQHCHCQIGKLILSVPTSDSAWVCGVLVSEFGSLLESCGVVSIPRSGNSVKISSEFISELPMCPFIDVTYGMEIMCFHSFVLKLGGH